MCSQPQADANACRLSQACSAPAVLWTRIPSSIVSRCASARAHLEGRARRLQPLLGERRAVLRPQRRGAVWRERQPPVDPRLLVLRQVPRVRDDESRVRAHRDGEAAVRLAAPDCGQRALGGGESCCPCRGRHHTARVFAEQPCASQAESRAGRLRRRHLRPPRTTRAATAYARSASRRFPARYACARDHSRMLGVRAVRGCCGQQRYLAGSSQWQLRAPGGRARACSAVHSCRTRAPPV